MPAGGFIGFLLRLLRQESRRSRLVARRRHGAGGLRRHNRHTQRLRHLGGRRQVFRRNERHRYGFRWYGGRRHGPRRGRRGGDGAGPSNAQAVPPAPLVIPEAQPPPAWILAGPAAHNLFADEEMEPASDDMDVDDPALAAPPPPLPCPVHGWACPRLAQQGIHVEEEAEPEVPESSSRAASPDLPSPTPAHELATAEPAQSRLDPPLHAPAAARDAVLDNDAGGSAAAAQPPQRRLRFIVPRAVLQASRAGWRPGEWSPARLSNGHSNGVAPGTQLPGGSSDEDEDGWSVNLRR